MLFIEPHVLEAELGPESNLAQLTGLDLHAELSAASGTWAGLDLTG